MASVANKQTSAFVSDVATLRAGACQNIEQGTGTPSYGALRQMVLKLLSEALATEIVCVLRYKRNCFIPEGIHSESVKKEFLEQANEEQVHAERIAKRIVQQGGEPNLDPDGLNGPSHAECKKGTNLSDMITEDLIAERVAIESYAEMIAYLEDHDSTTRKVLEGILAAEEGHAEDMASLPRNC